MVFSCSAVKDPAKALSKLVKMPKIITGRILAGDPALLNVLIKLPKGIYLNDNAKLYL